MLPTSDISAPHTEENPAYMQMLDNLYIFAGLYVIIENASTLKNITPGHNRMTPGDEGVNKNQAMSRITSLLLLLCLLSTRAMAQDLHFTQFQLAPMSFNASQTGAFNGTARVGGIYRDQWSIYKTPSIYIDAPILSVRKYDWIGVGFSAVKDQAGSAKLNLTGGKLAVAYHLSFDKKRKTVFSIGAQYGMMSRSINREALVLEDQIINGTPVSIDYDKIKDSKFAEIDAGVSLRHILSKKADFVLGVGVNHLNAPRRGIVNASFELPARLMAHGQLNMDLNKKWILSPAFLYQQIGPGYEAAVQAVGTYDFNKDWDFRAGLGYRFGDAAQVILGALYKDLTVGFAYDIGASGTNSALKNIGAFEIAANYIFKIYKKPKVDPAIFCPRF